MASQSRIINNYSWDQLVNIPEHNWIQKNSTQYQFLRSELIDKIFANLLGNDKELLLDSLVRIINFIHFRFGIKNDAGFWKQLIQNNLLDCKAFLNMTLPFINESEDSPDKKKKGLTKLSDLYIKKDERGQFLYTTSQYNRCVRHRTGDHTVIIERPFLREYFLNHLELLMMSIETVSNKLYINWIDILPVRINDYDNDLFKQTKSKIIGNITESKYDRDPITKINLINNYIDPLPGLTYQDVYNTIVNHLYHQIKNYRWLIFDIMVNGKLVCYINYFETRFHLKDLWDGKLWSQLPSPSRNGFANEWHNFLDSNQIEDNTVLNNIYFVFCKYYHNAERLVQLGLLICPTLDTEDLDEEDIVITSESTNTAKSALADVPVEEIYSFLCYQFSSFKESWYYYMIKIKKNAYVA